jgi:hypothetical protein
MTLFAIILVLIISFWVIASTWRSCRQERFRVRLFIGAIVLGVAVGVLLVNITRQPTETLKLFGFPFPLGGAEFLNGRWLGGLVSPYVLLALAADIAIGVAACLLPLRIILWRRHRDGIRLGTE